ncbi:hypothetical protein GCM10011487_14450 [Steroidobacter agaridevorans]|uniref:Uncharacterized protein n=1 Tax=Steroidobacter agaridevorans TaxID=2695856 RepID=A0A829Y8U5_9GAMM|nr:hypothetical protein [Steroidobacter agaridevorans]GFE79445.1 hypothetical protein GCM10011487_14450 [Steroidobacter agaridevorans]GFE88450.1 hypothetical protein GCM10011488_34040 [Steroidobacter agaridevorans]
MPVLPEDAVAHLRKRRDIHLGGQEMTPSYMASLLIRDAMVLGIDDLRVRLLSEGWTVVSGAQDWTRLGPGSELPRAALFRRLINFGQAGINEIRHEVYLVAYCSDAFAHDAAGLETLAGESPSPGVLATLEPGQFHMGFRV